MLGGSRKWSGVAFDEIGHVASTDISELIAESVSEVMMASKPSKLAKDVYDVVTNSLDEYMKYHDLKPDVSPTRVTAMASSAPEGVVTDPKFWGGGMEAMFPAQGAPAIPAPFPSVGKNKTYQAFDQDIVNAAVARGETTMIDPRTLWATQPKVTEDGVRHYMNSDELYADAAQAGNKYPVIYRRNEGNRTRNLILSGTHRSAAALAKGEQLEAIVVDGPWGPKR